MTNMEERAQTDKLAEIERALRGIKHALWAVALMLALLFVGVGVTMALPTIMFLSSSGWRASAHESTSAGAPEPFALSSVRSRRYYNDFPQWPLSKQVAESTVIVVTRFDQAGDSTKEVISEILKQTPGVEFPYRIGDTYSPWGDFSSHRKEMSETRASGEIIFLVGSPADPIFGTTYRATEDGVGGFGSITIKQLRKLVQASTADSPKK